MQGDSHRRSLSPGPVIILMVSLRGNSGAAKSDSLQQGNAICRGTLDCTELGHDDLVDMRDVEGLTDSWEDLTPFLRE